MCCRCAQDYNKRPYNKRKVSFSAVLFDFCCSCAVGFTVLLLEICVDILLLLQWSSYLWTLLSRPTYFICFPNLCKFYPDRCYVHYQWLRCSDAGWHYFKCTVAVAPSIQFQSLRLHFSCVVNSSHCNESWTLNFSKQTRLASWKPLNVEASNKNPAEFLSSYSMCISQAIIVEIFANIPRKNSTVNSRLPAITAGNRFCDLDLWPLTN